MAVLVFSIILDWFPSGTVGPVDASPFSWTHIKHFILPAVTLGWLASASLLRITRSAMLEILDSEYIKFARSKGVVEWKIIWKHAFKNAILQPLTLAAMTLAGFIGGAVVIERVFVWPGVGRLALEAVWNNDFPTITAVVLLWTSGFVVMNLIADVAYAYLDPRIRYQ
jgi:peptide/nickel transport system permease protein